VGIQVAGSPDVWKNGRKRTQRAETARRESEDVQMCGTDPVMTPSRTPLGATLDKGRRSVKQCDLT
jgi:hypothetical protein